MIKTYLNEGDCLHLADLDSVECTAEDIKKLKRWAKWVTWIPYTPTKFDCDDFTKVVYALAAFVIPGRKFGMIWANGILDGYHACNCYM